MKNTYIQLRVSEKEKAILQEKADRNHLSLSAYIRSTLLKEEEKVKKLTYAMYMNEEVRIKEEDLETVLKHFDDEIELTIDEQGRIWNEGGQYIADLEDEEAPKYIINFNTGAGNEEANTLAEAMRIAEANLAYTQESVTIELDGEEVARLPWWGRTPDEDEVVTEQFGDFGYYGEWETR